MEWTFCGFDPGAVPIMVIDIKEPYLLSYSSMTCLQIFLSFLALDSPNVIILSSYFVVLQVCKTHIPAVRISDGQNIRVCPHISGCQEIKCFFFSTISQILFHPFPFIIDPIIDRKTKRSWTYCFSKVYHIGSIHLKKNAKFVEPSL